MAKEVEYRQIKGRDEEIPVFRNLSRSVVKRGAEKIYWRKKETEAGRFGSWDDDVWLDCETGDIRFGERCVQESWRDYFDGVRADNFPRLGELDELIAEVQAGTSSEGEEASGEFAPATRSDALSDDWRERLASLLEYRLDRCNALFQAAKVLYVKILGTKVCRMKGVDVWGAPDGCDVDFFSAGGRPGNPTWLKIGALTEFYEEERGVYWGSDVKKEDKIRRKDDARQWLAREIGRRLEAALKAENSGV